MHERAFMVFFFCPLVMRHLLLFAVNLEHIASIYHSYRGSIAAVNSSSSQKLFAGMAEALFPMCKCGMYLQTKDVRDRTLSTAGFSCKVERYV